MLRRTRRTASAIALAAALVAGMAGAGTGAHASHGDAQVVYERMEVPAGEAHPFPRNAFGVAPGDGESFYLFGGAYEHFNSETPLYPHFGDLWRFSVSGSAGQWQKVHGCDPDDSYCGGRPCAPLAEAGCDLRLTSPSARAFPSLATLTDGEGHRFLALFGGTVFTKTFQNAPRLDSFWLYDLQAGSWEDLTPAPGTGPGPRNGAVGVANGSRFYVFGGIDAALQTSNDLWQFDLESREWTLLSLHDPDTGPVPRHSAHGAVVTTGAGERLVIYGGETVDVTTFSFGIPEDTWEFDLAGGAWRDLAPLTNISPTRNYAAASANAAGDHFVIQGGDVVGGVHGCGALFFEDPTNEVWVYDPAGNRWDERVVDGAVVPPGAKRHGAVQVGANLYVMGGWEFVCDAEGNGPGQVFNTDVYRFANP